MTRRSSLSILLVLLTALSLVSCIGRWSSGISEENIALRKELIAYADTFVGTKYRYGGKIPKTGFDCSGYTAYVFRKFGYDLGASSQIQYKESCRIARRKLLPGDLVFFGNSFTRKINHVGIYVGNNRMIHASTSKKRIMYADISTDWYEDHYIGVGRVLPDR